MEERRKNYNQAVNAHKEYWSPDSDVLKNNYSKIQSPNIHTPTYTHINIYAHSHAHISDMMR